MKSIGDLPHGRESYVSYYGEYVLKRPLPTLGAEAREKWLAKQHKTKDAIDSIRAVGNPIYNVPEMAYINDEEYQILERRAMGTPLTAKVFNALTKRQKVEIVNGIASFLVDMNESRPVKEWTQHKIADELKFSRLYNFVGGKMARWFAPDEICFMEKVCYEIGAFEYETRPVWSHCDLNPGNVLYDANNSRLSFIDFAEADYRFIYRDIFSTLAVELGICPRVYEAYHEIHDSNLYDIPDPNTENMRKIMKFRLMTVLLRRFIKAADDLRVNPANEKSVQNNENKIVFMRDVMGRIKDLEVNLK
ncbi:MAG: aminoglycoside phosphotransferase family protein [Alphaproteobacteria bacterium]|nr:aminoglycoside phosphotransferase family protein [Alphaproteobacteria bacterium]